MSGVYKGNYANPRVFDSGKPQSSGLVERRWTRGSGGAVQEFHEGSEAEMVYRMNALKSQYDSGVIRKVGDGDWYRLEMAQSDDSITDIFEVHGSSFYQSICINPIIKKKILEQQYYVDDTENPSFDVKSYTRLMSVIQSSVAKFRSELNYQAMLKRIFDDSQAMGNDITGATALMIKFVCDKIIIGEDHFLNANYTFRHTIAISERVFIQNGFSYQDVYNKTLKIHTEQLMRDRELIPDEFPLPPKISNNKQPAEWLKQPSKPEFQWGQKRAITTEYSFADKWEAKYYDLA